MHFGGPTIRTCGFQVPFQWNSRLRTKLPTVVGLVALASLLGACGVTNWISGSDSKTDGSADKKPAAGPSNTAASAPAAPNWDEIRAKMAESLVPDRKNARYSRKTIPRQSEELDPPAGGTASKPR